MCLKRIKIKITKASLVKEDTSVQMNICKQATVDACQASVVMGHEEEG